MFSAVGRPPAAYGTTWALPRCDACVIFMTVDITEIRQDGSANSIDYQF